MPKTKKKRQPQKKLPKGKPLIPNAGIARWYARTLQTYVKAMRAVVEPKIIEFFKNNNPGYAMDADIEDLDAILSEAQNASEEVFNDIAQQLSIELYDRIERSSDSALKGSISSIYNDYALNAVPLTEELRNTIQAGITDNVNYIKSIADEYFKRIIGEVMRTVTEGGSLSALTNDMFKYLSQSVKDIGRSTERRAQLIAQDQTRKAFNTVNLRKMEAVGIKKFIWIHSGGGKTSRPWHRDVLNGQICSIDNPPVIDPRTGEKGFPAQLPYCKCVMQPILDDTEEE